MVGRDKFFQLDDVSIFDLQLDSHNPRIRHGADQHECVARIVSERDTFLRLTRDIAQNGLSPEHILVSKSKEGKLVVRDGNRRVTALKLLNRPDLCLPDESLRNLLARIASEASAPIVDSLTCLGCDDEDVILDYLRRRHTGENAGIGQVGWSALLISLFNASSGVVDQNRRAAQLLLWMEDQGLNVPNDFPITTLTRLLNSESLAKLGFTVESDQIKPILPPAAAYALVARVVNDIVTRAVHVTREGGQGSIYSPEAATAYINKVRQEVGPAITPVNPPSDDGDGGQNPPPGGQQGGGPTPTPPSGGGNSDGDDAKDEPSGGGGSGGGQGQGNPGPSPAPGGGKPPAGPTVKPSWDRPCLFGRRKNSKADFAFPQDRKKLVSIVAELRQLDPNATPIAVNMLLRGLLELSDQAYRSAYKMKDLNGLHKNIASSADKMLQDGLLTKAEHHVVETYTRSEQTFLHVRSIQKNIHDDTYHPNGQALNTMWDSIGCFVRACWAGVMLVET